MTLKIIFNPISGKFDYINTSTAGSVSIPEYTTDPVSPAAEDVWVLKSNVGGITAGQTMGLLLSLTYAVPTLMYQLSYRTAEGTTKRTVLT